MRDIKFKVWDKINNKMYDYGSDEACELLEEGVDFMGMSFLSCQPNVIWLQYTGLKDKNGKEIYEGDIVTYENFSHAVYGAIAFGKIEVTAGGHQGFYIEWQNNGENKWRMVEARYI